MDLLLLLTILFLHFFGDFYLQSHWMASNKSKSNKALGLHCLVYTLVFIIISPVYAILNGIIHFVVDYFTSRFNAKLWERGDVHNFFVGVGLDQLIHYCTLILTYVWLF